jgi:hypothetical protein
MADSMPEPIDGALFALRETLLNGRESRVEKGAHMRSESDGKS